MITSILFSSSFAVIAIDCMCCVAIIPMFAAMVAEVYGFVMEAVGSKKPHLSWDCGPSGSSGLFLDNFNLSYPWQLPVMECSS